MNIQAQYQECRRAGMRASQALHTAKTLLAWREAESAGVVRIKADSEQEDYFSVWGDPEGYTNRQGHWVSPEKEKAELIESLNRDGCWVVFGEYLDMQGNWQHADSVGMCAGYRDPLDWRENWYVPDIMAAALVEREAVVNDAAMAI